MAKRKVVPLRGKSPIIYPRPSFLAILTAAGKYAYRRKDGICVVPITCLKD